MLRSTSKSSLTFCHTLHHVSRFSCNTVFWLLLTNATATYEQDQTKHSRRNPNQFQPCGHDVEVRRCQPADS